MLSKLTRHISVNVCRQLSSRHYSHPSRVANVLQGLQSRPTTSTWSSPNDRVVRNVFSSNYVHAWTLLEACLDQGNMTRAESVLFGLSEISTPSDVTLAVNSFLQKLIDLNANNPQAAISWLKKIEYRLPLFKRNDATSALLLRNACLHSEDHPHLLQNFIKSFSSSQLKVILKQVEILGPENIQKVMEAAEISIEDLDSSTRSALKALNEDSDLKPDMGSDIGKNDRMKLAGPIRKDGYESLEPTESSGLVAVRHVLTGLQLRSQAEQRGVAELAGLADLPHVKTVDSVDFFDMWKQLSTEEEKQKFSEVLEEINEKRQKNVETRGLEATRMRWRQMFEQMAQVDKNGGSKVQFRGLDTLMWEWNQTMTPLVENEFARLKLLAPYSKVTELPPDVKNHFKGMKNSEISDRILYGPYLLLSKPENLPAMTMMELLRINSKSRESVRSAAAILGVGKNVEKEYKLEVRKRDMKTQGRNKPGKRRKAKFDPEPIIDTSLTLRQKIDSVAHSWPSTIRAKIGSLLISMLMQAARVHVSGTDPVSGKKVRSTSPAFHHTYQYKNGTLVGVIRPHKIVANYLSGERVSIQPQQLPMLCKPRRWTSWDQGGYWYTPSTMIRTKNSPEQTAYVAAASARGQLQPVLDGLNVLGEVPWTINKEIFKVVSHIWNTKEEFLDIPPHVPPVADLSHIPVPPRNSDPSVLRDYRRKCRAITLNNSGLYSQRCDLNYKLDIARALLGERFYMPHNLDFRGRAYPLSPHFNHLGNDVSRSLLTFWEGRKLGKEGFWWLKVHLANLFGLNKSTHAERAQFVDDNIEKVKKCAENPLDPENGWWKDADSPFQALATCMEIKNALNHPDGPENFESHLTVHQDGSCNGLQHYAALGGDYEGAREVNLEKAERPQDVYSRVLEIVKAKVQNETSQAYKSLSQLLFPVLSRKVVKQTVMTHVYGVTYVGARTQIGNRLREIEGFPSDQVYKAASYLANLILGAVRELFESAHEIQDWLGDNATRISRSIVTDGDLKGVDSKFVSSVIWTSPLGLPIVQPYRQEKQQLVKTQMQTLSISDPYSFQGVNARKQRTAFPPNYIHSLDATHMLMSAMKCSEDNIAFAAVHDSYWTHAADVGTLNKNLRECFVTLHSKNLIQKLKDEFQVRYGSHLEVVKIPKESQVAKRIEEIYKDYAISKYGKATKLSISDKIELEAAFAGEKQTPLDVMKSLSSEEILELTREADLQMKSLRPTQMKPSTEHEGTGLDTIIDEDDDKVSLKSEEPEELEELEEEGSKSKRKFSKALEVFVPLRIPDIPTRDSFDVKNVLDSPYFFS